MDQPELPRRLYSLGDEPHPMKSIGYYSGDTKLFTALSNALERDEWEEIRNSRLGMFIKLYELDFGWASRLVHYMLSMQLQCKKKYEIWCLIGATPARFSLHEFEEITGLNCDEVDNFDAPEIEVTEEIREFWELLGVDIESGPSVDSLTAACGMCKTWSREDRLRLGYLAIYAGFIEAKKPSTATRVRLARLVMDLDGFLNYPWGRVAFKRLIESVKQKDLSKGYTIEGFIQVLQVWVYYVLPDFAAEYGEPIAGMSPPMLAYKGARGRKYVREAMVKQTRINICRPMEFDEMFDLWDDDDEDDKVDNIIKAIYGRLDAGGKWTWSKRLWDPIGVKTCTQSSQVKSEMSPSSKRSIDVSEGSRKKSRCSESTTYVTADGGWGEVEEKMKTVITKGFASLADQMREGFANCTGSIKELATRVSAVEEVVSVLRGMKEGEVKGVGGDQLKSNNDVNEEDKLSEEQVKSNEEPAKSNKDDRSAEKEDNVGVSTKPSTQKKKPIRKKRGRKN